VIAGTLRVGNGLVILAVSGGLVFALERYVERRAARRQDARTLD
jgi:hypothetical protein